MKGLKISKIGYLAMSVVFYIAGLFCMTMPQMEPLAVCVLSGVALVVYGGIKITGYLAKDLYCLAFQYDLACGLLFLTLGVIILARNTGVMPYLAPGLGLLILLDSLLTVQMAKDAKQFGLEVWYVILILSIAAGVFGVLLMIEPFENRLPSHILAGSALIAAGLKNHCVIAFTVKGMKGSLKSAGDRAD